MKYKTRLKDIFPRMDGALASTFVDVEYTKGSWYISGVDAKICTKIQKYLPASYKQYEVLIKWP